MCPACRIRRVLGLLLALAIPLAVAGQTPEKKKDAVAPVPLLVLKGHTKGVYHVAVSRDGKLLASSSRDGTVKLWDSDGKELRTLKGRANHVYSAAFSPDGKTLAVAADDKTVRLWEVESGKEVRALGEHGDSVYAVAFSPDGKRLASSCSDQKVRLWDPATGKLLHTLEGHTDRVLSVTFSPDGRRLVSACGTSERGGNSGGEVKVWNAASGEELFSLPPTTRGVLTVALSPDGNRLAGACLDQRVRLWELASGSETLVLAGHTGEVYGVAFSPDGRRLASCGGKWNTDQSGEVKVWELPSGTELLSFKGHATPTWSLAFSPDGGRLATASGKWDKDEAGEVKVWDLTALVKEHRAAAPALTPKELEALWADLAERDAVRAYRAVWALSGSPKESVQFLKEHARLPAGNATDRIPQLIAELDDGDFQVRERASEALEQLGRAAHPALRKALESPSAEVRRRAERLLEKKGDPPALTAEELRTWRAIEVLVRIGTAEVRPVLRQLAEGKGSAALARDAAAALARVPEAP
jgi:WD40 repeat protein